MDADVSHDPADLPRLLALAREGADLVLGSRYVPGGGVDGWHRRAARSAAPAASTRAPSCASPVRDLTGGFKCLRAGALRAIEPSTVRSQGYAFQVELTYRALRRGLRVVEMPIVFRERGAGRLEDVARGSPSRRPGSCPRCAHPRSR